MLHLFSHAITALLAASVGLFWGVVEPQTSLYAAPVALVITNVLHRRRVALFDRTVDEALTSSTTTLTADIGALYED